MAPGRPVSDRSALRRWFGALLVAAAPLLVTAHELQPGFLEITEQAGPEGQAHPADQPVDYAVLWKQPLSLGQPLRLTPVFPATCRALDEPSSERLTQSWVYRARIRCPVSLAGQVIAIDGLEALSTDVLVRVQHASGTAETHLLKPESPQVTLAAAGGPRGIWTYFTLGVEHIALGVDHLLFVLGLLLIVRDRWMLFKTITSFTVAHSITLALATLVRIQVPAGALNACIALSILFLAPEVVRIWRGQTSLTIRQPWLVAFLFGLLHGFGFASGLASLGIPQAEVPLALLLFNLGVEAGQLGFVALVFALRGASRALEVHWPRWAAAIPAYVLGSLGAYWTLQRTLMIFGIKF